MPISGLVITLDEDPSARTHALEVLARDPRLALGVPFGARLPAVAESPSANEAEELVRALADEPGIVFVDVVSVDISLDEEV
jgi:hypothetical protein